MEEEEADAAEEGAETHASTDDPDDASPSPHLRTYVRTNVLPERMNEQNQRTQNGSDAEDGEG